MQKNAPADTMAPSSLFPGAGECPTLTPSKDGFYFLALDTSSEHCSEHSAIHV